MIYGKCLICSLKLFLKILKLAMVTYVSVTSHIDYLVCYGVVYFSKCFKDGPTQTISILEKLLLETTKLLPLGAAFREKCNVP